MNKTFIFAKLFEIMNHIHDSRRGQADTKVQDTALVLVNVVIAFVRDPNNKVQFYYGLMTLLDQVKKDNPDKIQKWQKSWEDDNQ